MKCEEIQELLTAYLLGDLDAEKTGLVRDHLEVCDGCRAAMREIEPTLDLLRDALATTSTVPKRLSPARKSRILRESAGHTGGKIEFWIFRSHPAFAIAASMLIATGFLWLLAWNMHFGSVRERARRIEVQVVMPEAMGPAEELALEELDDIVEAPTSPNVRSPDGRDERPRSSVDDPAGREFGDEQARALHELHHVTDPLQINSGELPDSRSDEGRERMEDAEPPHEAVSSGEAPAAEKHGETAVLGKLLSEAGGRAADAVTKKREAADETIRLESRGKAGVPTEVAKQEPVFSDTASDSSEVVSGTTHGYSKLKGDLDVVASKREAPADRLSARADARKSRVAQAPAAKARLKREPVEKKYELDISSESAPLDAPTTPAVAASDLEAIARAPVTLRGLYAGRIAKGREQALEAYVGGSAGKTSDEDATPGDKEKEQRQEEDNKHAMSQSQGKETGRDASPSRPPASDVGAITPHVGPPLAAGREFGDEQARALHERHHVTAPLLQNSIEEETGARFKAVGVNPFHTVAEKPFSTFGIDVDTASYTLARNYMSRGFLPPAEAVRTEEFVNFFDYAYKPPVGRTFTVYADCAPSRFGHGLHILKIGVKGRRLGREEQRRAVLTFLIDTSGSMEQSDRLGLAQKALLMLVDKLAPEDLVAIVQYDSHARLVLEHTPVSRKERIIETITNLQCGRSTNLEEGMKRAYEVASMNFVGGAENRVLLLSDGAANLGALASEDILKSVEEYRKQGIYCSVFGFGMGAYDDPMLEGLADKGNGAYAFIDSEDEAKRILADDLSATLNTIASDVKIQVEFNPNRVKRYRQLGYENRQLQKEDFRNDAVDAGEVGSGQSATALYELDLGEENGKRTGERLGIVRLRYRRTDTGKVEETEHEIGARSVLDDFDGADARFRLAACVAEFAEILRGSPFAAGSEYADIARRLRPVALELNLDRRVQELLRMADGARSMSRGM